MNDSKTILKNAWKIMIGVMVVVEIVNFLVK